MDKKSNIVPIILSIVGSAGTVATGILAAKETKKLLDDYTPNEFEKLKKEISKSELLKMYLKAYWPAIVVGAASVTSGTVGTVLSKKTEASLIAAATLADQGWRKYKDQIKTTLGLNKHKEMLEEIAKEEYPKRIHVSRKDPRKMYWEEHIGYFLADPEKLALAYADLNQRIQFKDAEKKTDHFAMIYNLIEDSDAELINKNLKGEDLNWGWTDQYLEEAYAHQWIHMRYSDEVTDDGNKYTMITFAEEPIFNPGNYGESFLPDTDISDLDKMFELSGYGGNYEESI